MDPRLKIKKINLDSDLLPAHELGMALRQPDTALQQSHRGSGLQQIKKIYISVGVNYFLMDIWILYSCDFSMGIFVI